MGNGVSSEGGGAATAASMPTAGETRLGYHVLMVQQGSPAEEAGLEAYFDFLVAVNGRRLDKDDGTLLEELKASVNRPVRMVVYSSKTEQLREISMVPSNSWNGVGHLGARVRFCDFENANEHVWHILDVQGNSPAERAGLQAHEDYVIASPDTLLHDQGAFAEQVKLSMHKPMRLFVYNKVSDTIREVTIIPDRDWGGAGSLGCDVGYGYLHRIPRPDPTRPSQARRQAPVSLSIPTTTPRPSTAAETARSADPAAVDAPPLGPSQPA